MADRRHETSPAAGRTSRTVFCPDRPERTLMLSADWHRAELSQSAELPVGMERGPGCPHPGEPVALPAGHSPAFIQKQTIRRNMKEDIRKRLEEVLPIVDFDSDFLFQELDSLGITTILMTLSDMYGIELDRSDVTPKNFKTLGSLVELVKKKLNKDAD